MLKFLILKFKVKLYKIKRYTDWTVLQASCSIVAVAVGHYLFERADGLPLQAEVLEHVIENVFNLLVHRQPLQLRVVELGVGKARQALQELHEEKSAVLALAFLAVLLNHCHL